MKLFIELIKKNIYMKNYPILIANLAKNNSKRIIWKLF